MVKKYNVKVNGQSYEVEVEEVGTSSVNQEHNTNSQTPLISNQSPQPTTPENKPVPSKPKEAPKKEISENSGSQSSVEAPMSGLVIDVKVKKGDNVNPGDKLLVLEAMKMENDIVSDINGTINEIHCKKGDNVETGEILITIS